MYFEEHGDRNNDALVLLHSGGMGSIEWKPQIAQLSENFNLFVPDLLGHGKSLIPDGQTLSISLIAEAVAEMLHNEGISQAHICGSSMGGAAALWLCLHHSQLVNRLIIYRMGYTKNIETYEQTRAMANPEFWRQYGMHRWLSRVHKPQGDENSWETVVANVSRVLDPATSDHKHSIDDLRRIAAKTLLIAGDRDPIVSLETLFEMKNAIEDCALWVIPEAAHVTASNTWRADAFSEELTRFLGKK